MKRPEQPEEDRQPLRMPPLPKTHCVECNRNTSNMFDSRVCRDCHEMFVSRIIRDELRLEKIL